MGKKKDPQGLKLVMSLIGFVVIIAVVLTFFGKGVPEFKSLPPVGEHGFVVEYFDAEGVLIQKDSDFQSFALVNQVKNVDSIKLQYQVYSEAKLNFKVQVELDKGLEQYANSEIDSEKVYRLNNERKGIFTYNIPVKELETKDYPILINLKYKFNEDNWKNSGVLYILEIAGDDVKLKPINSGGIVSDEQVCINGGGVFLVEENKCSCPEGELFIESTQQCETKPNEDDYTEDKCITYEKEDCPLNKCKITKPFVNGGEFECHSKAFVATNTCVIEGSNLGGNCCPGLERIQAGEYVQQEGCKYYKTLGVCSKIDGVCQDWENSCNVPKDCDFVEDKLSLSECKEKDAYCVSVSSFSGLRKFNYFTYLGSCNLDKVCVKGDVSSCFGGNEDFCVCPDTFTKITTDEGNGCVGLLGGDI